MKLDDFDLNHIVKTDFSNILHVPIAYARVAMSYPFLLLVILRARLACCSYEGRNRK